MKTNRFWILAAIIAAVALALVALPTVASAWYLNLANAQIARGVALPADSPVRGDALIQAEINLNQARAWSDQPRIATAQVRVWLARGEPHRAMESIRPMVQDDVVAQLIFGTAEMQAGKSDAAYPRWRTSEVFNYFIDSAHRARVAHRWDEVERLARIAVGIDPKSADAHYVLGDVLSRQPASVRDAISELELAEKLTADPELRATILSRKGEILAAQGDSAAAFTLFEKAMDVAPLDARPRTNYARLLLQMQPSALNRAEEMLKHAISIAPWDTLAFATLAEIAESRGELSKAEDWYMQGFARNPDHPALLFYRAQFYARQNRLSDARQSMIQALRYETRGDELLKIARALEALK